MILTFDIRTKFEFSRIESFKMKITVNISKLVAADQEYVTSFGPSGDKRMSKLEYYVKYILLPMEREEFKEIFARGFRSHQLTDLRDMIMYSLETIFEAEFRKKEETEKEPAWRRARPGQFLFKHLANTFMPHLHADINGTIEYDTVTGSWNMK